LRIGKFGGSCGSAGVTIWDGDSEGVFVVVFHGGAKFELLLLLGELFFVNNLSKLGDMVDRKNLIPAETFVVTGVSVYVLCR
jgi:hypothetical protein